MASYSVVLKPSVEKDLRALPRAALARVMQRIDELKSNPTPRQSVKLTGAERLYRLRVGDYRIIYEVNVEASRVVIHYVRHRREAYRDL
jgi:mRNA interferase RelE/StbE